MIADLRLAFRQLAKSPGFTATVIVAFALSPGAAIHGVIACSARRRTGAARGMIPARPCS